MRGSTLTRVLVWGLGILLVAEGARAGDPVATHGAGSVNAGCPAPAFEDDVESGAGNFSTSSPTGNGDWSIQSTSNASSSPSAWVSTSVGEIKDDSLDTVPIQVPSRGASLSFHHVVDLEFERDGGVLEISVDGGPFFDLCSRVEQGALGGVIATQFGSPIAEHAAWTGQVGPPAEEVIVDLDPYAGSEVVFRFRLTCDEANGGGSWTVDDLRVVESGGKVVTPVLFVSHVEPVVADDFESPPPPTVPLFRDDLECGNGLGLWTHYALPTSDLPNDPWRLAGGTWAATPGSPFTIQDYCLELAPLSIPAEGAIFTVRHEYSLPWEDLSEFCYAGGVLEGSTDGVNFFDMEPHFISHGYERTVYPQFGSPLGGRRVWAFHTNSSFVQTFVDLSSFAGESLTLRFRLATSDRPGPFSGMEWYIGDVELLAALPPSPAVLLTEFFERGAEDGTSTWTVVEDAAATSPPKVAYCEARGSKEEYLDLREFRVTADAGLLRFRHRWDLQEARFDGAVLEASVDGGPFQDLSPFFLGGQPYNRMIDVDSGTGIAGRMAWSANSGPSMVFCFVDLSSFLGSDIVIRWYLSCGGTFNRGGWWIDDVSVGGFDGTGGVDHTVELNRLLHPLRIELSAPPLGPARPPYVLYGWAGEPDGTMPTVQPFGIGTLLFGNPAGGGVQPILILNNVGNEGLVGASTIPQGQVPDAPGVLLERAAGDYPAGAFTLQAIVRDRGSAGDRPASVSNAVIVRSN